MADNRPPQQDRKLPYVAPLVIAVLVVAIIATTFFNRPPAQPAAIPNPPQKSNIAKPAPANTIRPPSPLTRGDLIRAVQAAADEFTITGKLPEAPDPLIGRRFSVRIAFGCGGVQGGYGPSQMSLAYDTENRSITLTAVPGVWSTLPLMQGVTGDGDIEAVEGFSIPRPWTRAKSCPLVGDYPLPATPTPPTAQTLGLAQLFESGGSRVSQHAERPYSFTRKVREDDQSILTHSYRLILEGVISGYKNGLALRCWMEAPDHQPICIYAVRFDSVGFEDATTGEKLANWN